jgi:hypothetical protein
MRLATTTFDKKSYIAYVKSYMKKLKAKLQETHPERVEAFEKGAQAYVKKVIGSFKDWEFLTGESMDTDGMVALLNYRDDGVTPYIVFFKDGLEEVKLVCVFFWVGLMVVISSVCVFVFWFVRRCSSIMYTFQCHLHCENHLRFMSVRCCQVNFLPE